MIKKRALAASRDPEYEILGSNPNPDHSIIFNTGAGHAEMLRVTQDGFFVRGIKVPADEKEAELVYNAFKEFLVYHNLARTY